MVGGFSMRSAVLAAAAFTTTCLAAQSTFISPSESLAFAISIPDEANNSDVYFSLAFPAGEFWAAVGLGNDKMAGTLVLMAYPSASGENVTLSPRLATGHTEPEYYSGLEYETLTNRTGLVNGSTYEYSAVCHNCRSWPGGSIDVNSTAQEFVFATGPSGNANSDSQQASVKIHYEYGRFTMDLQHATGAASPAVLNSTIVASDDGASLVGKVTENMTDWFVVFHGIFMIGCFLGLMPLGVLILKLGQWVRWHGLNQGFAMIGVVVGFGLGVKTSTYYNRSKHFNTAHQIIGLLVLLFVLAQFTLGIVHHRVFKKTQRPTKLKPLHVWFGRGAIVLGIANGFLGFPLALSPEHDYILGGLVIALCAFVLFVLLCKRCLGRIKSRQQPEADAQPPGYSAEPWAGRGQPHSTAESFEMRPVRKSGSAAREERAPPAYSYA